MIDERWSRLRALFEQLEDMPEAGRIAILDRELAGEPELRRELEALLENSDSAAGFLSDRNAPVTGSSVGPYQLLEPLGEGGFGVVYLAEQFHPIRRRVALKLIKPGMDTKQVVTRFKTEQQALALMDHSGIAQVFDAGETEQGRPYFAMEYVPGVAITTFCDREKLRLHERLQLFLQVCDAIQHAHQKGVIHRDLKPSNVLVARRDGVLAIKVIDFGIVKATGDALNNERTMTREGVVLGTVGYMSPEQIGAIEAPVDTRSDIYSLGVVLYELLSGDLPFDRARLRGATWAEAVRIIREEDPSPPAAHAARSETGEIAERRSTDSRTLLRDLKGELAWIALRALEKEPDRRYPSASELAADIRRYLANEPVLAGAPSTMYRLRKYARRHRVGVTAAGFVLLAIVAGGVAAGIGLNRAVRAERVARREAEASRQVSDFLVNLFHASSPDKSKGETVTARVLLDEGTRRIESLEGDPHVRARLLGAMGDSYLNLEYTEEGIRLTRAALAATEAAVPRNDLEIARKLDKLANAFSMAGQLDSIPPVVERAITLFESTGSEDPDLYSSFLYRKVRYLMEKGDVAPADSILTIAIGMAESLPEPSASRLTRMYSAKASLAHWRYDLDAAGRNYQRALELADEAGEPMRSAALHTRLGGLYIDQGEPEKALTQVMQGVALARKIYAPDHHSLAEALSGQTMALMSLERFDEAIQVQEEAVGILKDKGTVNEHIAFELQLLGNLYLAAGRHDLAIARAREACDAHFQSLGPDHFRTGGAIADLARCCVAAGRTAEADSLFKAAVDLLHRIGDSSVLLPQALSHYADFCRDEGRAVRADSLYAGAEAVLDSTNEGLRPLLGDTRIGRARLRALQGRHGEAEEMMAAGFRLKRGDLPEHDEGLADAYLAWASVRALAGNSNGATERLGDAVRCGATPEDVAEYPELEALSSRAD